MDGSKESYYCFSVCPLLRLSLAHSDNFQAPYILDPKPKV